MSTTLRVSHITTGPTTILDRGPTHTYLEFVLCIVQFNHTTQILGMSRPSVQNGGGARENKGEWFGMMYLLGAIRRL